MSFFLIPLTLIKTTTFHHIIHNDYLNAEIIRMDGGIRMQAK